MKSVHEMGLKSKYLVVNIVLHAEKGKTKRVGKGENDII